jgi:hypothetical protein
MGKVLEVEIGGLVGLEVEWLFWRTWQSGMRWIGGFWR